jgi:hypothetical protein
MPAIGANEAVEPDADVEQMARRDPRRTGSRRSRPRLQTG